jgi:hypothetical protein
LIRVDRNGPKTGRFAPGTRAEALLHVMSGRMADNRMEKKPG